MVEDANQPANAGASAADRFTLLADETRASILRELGRAWTDDWPGVVTYSDLMDRVNAVDSGRFNYHLSKLVDVYVSDRDDGYKLNFPGLRVYRTIVAGSITEPLEFDDVDVEATCFECDGGLVGRYADTIASIHCGDCGLRYGEYPLPPRGALDRSPRDVLVTADRRARQNVSQFLAGVCPWCGSDPSTQIETSASSDIAAWADTPFDVHVIHTCEACGALHGHSVGKRLLTHPPILEAFHSRDHPLLSIPSWELEFVATDRWTTVVETDPWRIGVRVPVDDEAAIEVTLDGSLDAVRTEETAVDPTGN